MIRPVAVVLVVFALAAPTLAGPASTLARSDSPHAETLLDAIRDVRLGGGSVGFGLDVSPLGPWSAWNLSPITAEPGVLGPHYGLLDPGTAISFDVKLRWPSMTDPVQQSPLQPYVTFGPALLMPETSTNLIAPVTKQPMTLGVRAGAGVHWRFNENATLFGEYRFTRSPFETVLPFGGKSSSDIGGFDVLYGMRLRF